jgi:hypothetical protein
MEIGKPEKYESSLQGNQCISISGSCNIKDNRISYARTGAFDGPPLPHPTQLMGFEKVPKGFLSLWPVREN